MSSLRGKGKKMVLKRMSASVLAVCLLLVSNARAQFWYGVDGPVPLKIDSLRVTVNNK